MYVQVLLHLLQGVPRAGPIEAEVDHVAAPAIVRAPTVQAPGLDTKQHARLVKLAVAAWQWLGGCHVRQL